MSAAERRLGPHLAILAHQLRPSGSLSEWSRWRAAVLGTADAATAPRLRDRTGPPHVRFADIAEARAWYGRARNPLVYTWALHDGTGAGVAVSSWAFPTAVMAERDARTVQEFVEQLSLHFVTTADEQAAWHAELDGHPTLHSSTAPRFQADAVRIATTAVGLLPVATVAAFAVEADPTP